MSAVTEPKVDLDAIERDCEKNIVQLRAAVSRLSLDALTLRDPAVREELVDVERKLADAEAELQRVALARAEQERRAMEARQAEQDARQRAAYAEAQRLQPDREKAAKAVDKAAAAHVAAVCGYVDVCRQQQARLTEAGRRQQAHIARPFGFAIEASFAHAMQEAKWSGSLRGVDVWARLGLIPPRHQQPLAESDAKPVEGTGQ